MTVPDWIILAVTDILDASIERGVTDLDALFRDIIVRRCPVLDTVNEELIRLQQENTRLEGLAVEAQNARVHAEGSAYDYRKAVLEFQADPTFIKLHTALVEAQRTASAAGLAELQSEDQCRKLASELEKLRQGIRAHRDARGDDRCWQDDEELYKVLPEGYTPPLRDTTVELERCRQYISSRQNPATTYVSPEREIERLRALLLESKQTHYHCEDSWYCCPMCDASDHGLAPGEVLGVNTNRYALPSGACNCGADAWNKKVDEALR